MATTGKPRFLVTAGNTRERIDDVRDWGNIFTGNTGYRIARALSRVGEVDLLTSNRIHLAELQTGAEVHAEAFTTHADLRARLAQRLNNHTYQAIFMTAAVSDFRPAGAFEIVSRRALEDGRETWTVRDIQAGKVKSDHDEIAIIGARTEKLVDLFRGTWRYRGLLVKFKLEVGLSVEELIAIGQRSRVASGADYLVANTLAMVEGENAGAYLLSDTGAEWVPRAALAERLVEVVTASSASRPPEVGG